jgi:hypothetical protein
MPVALGVARIDPGQVEHCPQRGRPAIGADVHRRLGDGYLTADREKAEVADGETCTAQRGLDLPASGLQGAS